MGVDIGGTTISAAVVHQDGSIVTIVNLLNPQMVVIAGGIAKAGEILFKRLEHRVMMRGLPATVKDLKILPAQLGDAAGVLGAAAFALEGISSEEI